MKTVGIFEAKTKLSDICDEVSRTGVPVMVTRRGTALVRIDPIQEKRLTVKERLAEYKVKHGAAEEADAVDFEVVARASEAAALKLPVSERAALVEHLIASLDDLDEKENERLWLEEAENRYRLYKTGKMSSRPAQDVHRDVRNRMR